MKRLAALAATLLLACGPKAPPPRPAPPPVALHLEPICDVVPGGASWVAAVTPRAIAEVPDLIPAVGLVFGEERLRQFASAHGGVDLRQIKELCVARYRDALLSAARVPLDPERVAAAFAGRSVRATVKTTLAPNPHVFRMTGDTDGEPAQLLVLGHDAVVEEEGKPGPLRAVEAFAFGKLKRSQPILKSAALERTVALLEDAPVRVLAPGPFDGEAANGLGGLLRATTAVGGSARWSGKGAGIAIRLVLSGAWGGDAPAAAERLAAAVHVLAESVAGRLFGLQHPLDGPRVRGDDDALVLDAIIDGNALARGVHDAVDADVAEMMRR